MLYGRQICAVAWPRYCDRWYCRGNAPLSVSIRIPNSRSNPSSSEVFLPLFGQLHQNQARYASIWTIFKSWQQQETILPIYSKKKAKSRPKVNPSMSPLRTIKPGGGGGPVTGATKEGFRVFGCTYSRRADDPKSDNEDFDIAKIEALIEERNDARLDRNFERADAIRDELKKIHGVYLNDQERTWGANNSVAAGYLGNLSRMTRQFGPNGHNYQLCEDAGPSISPLSEDEIHNLIAERLWCRLKGEFVRADEIKVELMAKDVAIDDLKKVWRADGVGFESGRKRNDAYTYAPDAGPSQADMTDEEVVELLADRQKCRDNHDFDDADLIRSNLFEAGVQIDDKNRLWRADGKPFRSENRDGGDDEGLFGEAKVYHGDKGRGNGNSSRMTERFGPHGHDYKLCNDAGPSISPLSDDEIHKRIAERLRCKLNRDFERADEIKVDLMVKDVAIDDVSKLWRADGFLVYVARGHNNKLNYTYAPDAGPSQATMTDEEVVKLLAVRHECRQNRDFAGADFIRVDLWEAGVQVDDVNRLWRADGTSFRDENRDVYNGDKDLFGDSAVFRGDKLDG